MQAMRCFGNDAVELVHLRRTADDAAESLLRLDLFAQHAVFRLELQMVADSLQQQLEFFQAEGLGDEVECAGFHCLHRRLHSAMAGHDDHFDIRPVLLDLTQHFHAAGAWQLQIEKDNIKILGVNQP